MPSFPTDPKDKALAQRASTSSARTPWQEALDRHVSIPASKAAEAAEVIRGFAGSWAASYALEDSLRSREYAEGPAAIQTKQNHLGQPGMAEINFRPYDARTNRFGPKGPSLLGHPISFSIVGPTLKSPLLDFQWLVSSDGYTLTIDTASIYSTAGTPALPALDTLATIYNLSAIPDGGLYLVVSQTGSRGDLDGNVGGLGDGQFGEDLAVLPNGPRSPIIPLTEGSKYEVFRVVSFVTRGADLVGFRLDTNKSLTEFFDFPVGRTPVLRAVTLFVPAATRLVAVPGSGEGVGKEKVFAFVPPARSLNADYMPPYRNWTVSGRFDPWTNFEDPVATGTVYAIGPSVYYNEGISLPIPTPVFTGFGRVHDSTVDPPNIGQLGLGAFISLGGHFDASDVGRILHVYEAESIRGGELANSSDDPQLVEATTPMETLLGYYQITAAMEIVPGTFLYGFRRILEFDPTTGVPNYGSARLNTLSNPGAGRAIRLKWRIHDSISTLWTSSTANMAALSASRLTNLIDPSWVQPALKRGLGFPGLQGRPDRATFDTSSSGGGADGTNANPGSLADLGFRVVLFPAKLSGGRAVPDFDNPITSNEVLLDPDKPTEDQWIEVDYSAGLLRLSHAPVEGSVFLPTLGTLTATDNPRGEVVIFASCVPYSVEPGQLGGNQRVTGRVLNGSADDTCLIGSVVETTDVWSGRLSWPIENNIGVQSQTQQEIKLSEAVLPTQMPMTGFVEVVTGTRPVGPAPTAFIGAQGSRAATFGYSQVIYADPGNGGNTTLRGVFGGGPLNNTTVPTLLNRHRVTLRRDTVSPNTSDGRAGTDFQFDTTYGFAARSNALHFEHATIRKEVDGSATVHIKDPETTAHQRIFGDVLSSALLDGGIFVASPTPGQILVEETTVLIDGIRSVLPPVALVFPTVASTYYLYIDGSDPRCPSYAFAEDLPLPSQHDILLGRYDQSVGVITAIVHLLLPLTDLDQRVNITVGDYDPAYGSAYRPHFKTLSEAVRYVNELASPINSGGSGDHPRFFRIQVVGPVYEERDNLPIRIKTSGLIIEGVHRNMTGASVPPNSPSTIWWDDNIHPLFDLQRYNDTVFRNLALKYDGAVPAALNGATCAFTLNFDMEPPPGFIPWACKGILIEGCRFDGDNAVAFFFLQSLTGAQGQISDSIIRDNISATRNAGVWVYGSDGAPRAFGLRVENNQFDCSQAAVLGDVRDLVRITGHRNIVRGNHLIDAYGGVTVQGDGNVVETNTIATTAQAGILADGIHNLIHGNRLSGVHTDNVIDHLGGIPGKVGIDTFYTAGAASFTQVTDNDIQLAGVFDPNSHWGIRAPDTSNVVSNNQCQASAIVGELSTISGNVLATTGRLLVTGRSMVSGNFYGDGAIIGQFSVFSGNGGGVVVFGADCKIDGNSMTDATVSDRCVLTGNTLTKMLTGGVATERLTLSGNRFTGDLTGADALKLSYSLIGDNIFEGAVVFTAGSRGLTIIGNRFLDADASGYAATLEPGCFDIIFTSNLLSGGFLSGTDVGNVNQLQFVDNLTDTGVANSDFVIYGNNLIVQGNTTLTGGIGVQGSDIRVANNLSSGTQALIQHPAGPPCGLGVQGTGGSCLVEGNRVAQDVYVSGSSAQIESNHFAKGGAFYGNRAMVRGNTTTAVFYVSGSNMIVQGNTAPSVASAAMLYGGALQAPGSVFSDNVFTASPSIKLGNGSDNVVIHGNQCAGNIELAFDDGAGAIASADLPTVSNNEVGGDILCAASAGAVMGGCVDPDIHGNRVGGNVVCSVTVGGGFGGATQPMVAANRVTGWIAVNTGYTVMGNRAAGIGRAVADAAADPDADGMVMGNRIVVAGTIFGVAPTDTIGGDPGHRKINTVQ